jgi:hypothetical protein
VSTARPWDHLKEPDSFCSRKGNQGRATVTIFRLQGFSSVLEFYSLPLSSYQVLQRAWRLGVSEAAWVQRSTNAPAGTAHWACWRRSLLHPSVGTRFGLPSWIRRSPLPPGGRWDMVVEGVQDGRGQRSLLSGDLIISVPSTTSHPGVHMSSPSNLAFPPDKTPCPPLLLIHPGAPADCPPSHRSLPQCCSWLLCHLSGPWLWPLHKSDDDFFLKITLFISAQILGATQYISI